jgi:hypothetical protein
VRRSASFLFKLALGDDLTVDTRDDAFHHVGGPKLWRLKGRGEDYACQTFEGSFHLLISNPGCQSSVLSHQTSAIEVRVALTDH